MKIETIEMNLKKTTNRPLSYWTKIPFLAFLLLVLSFYRCKPIENVYDIFVYNSTDEVVYIEFKTDQYDALFYDTIPIGESKMIHSYYDYGNADSQEAIDLYANSDTFSIFTQINVYTPDSSFSITNYHLASEWLYFKHNEHSARYTAEISANDF